MDDRERDKFYSPPRPPNSAIPDATDEDEYEIEPPDESVEEFRKKAIRESLEPRIDINEVYRDADRDRGSEILEGWLRNFTFKFQFRVKHLLIATAVLAIVLTLIRLELFWTTAVILVMLGVAGLYLYLKLEEKKQQAEADRRREQIYAARRAKLDAQTAGPGVRETLAQDLDASSRPLLPNEVDRIWNESLESDKFRFQFSLRELILAMTTAAVVLGMIRLLGGPAATASLLGLIALVGLFVYAMGFEPPQIVVLGWWLTLVLYVLVSISAVIWGGFA